MNELKPARLEEVCAKCGKPLDVRPGATFRADTAGRVWHYGCAPTASPTPTNDAEGLIEAYREALKVTTARCAQYADYIRDEVKADDLERHPYLPQLDEEVAEALAALNQGAGQ